MLWHVSNTSNNVTYCCDTVLPMKGTVAHDAQPRHTTSTRVRAHYTHTGTQAHRHTRHRQTDTGQRERHRRDGWVGV